MTKEKTENQTSNLGPEKRVDPRRCEPADLQSIHLSF